jgi:flagellar hook-length control protein FliK
VAVSALVAEQPAEEGKVKSAKPGHAGSAGELVTAAVPEAETKEGASAKPAPVPIERLAARAAGLNILQSAPRAGLEEKRNPEKSELVEATGSVKPEALSTVPKMTQPSGVPSAHSSVEAGAAAKGAVPQSGEAAPAYATLPTLGSDTVKHIRYLVSSGEKSITVRLVPASLGEMHLEVTSTGDRMDVRLVSSNPVVREALQTHLSGLRDSLGRDGIKLGNVEVASSMTGGANSGGQLNQGASQQDAAARPNHSFNHVYVNQSPEPASAPRRAVSQHSGSLNVFV